jgi:cation diffusion facilitator family transporter
MTPRKLQALMLLSILAALATVGLKTAAYWLTGSVGLLSDALESIVNLVAAVTAIISLWYSSQPVDASHTYGHEKIEYFSSGLEGVLVMAAAVGMAWVAVKHLLAPHQLESLDIGMVLGAAAAGINLGVGHLLLRAGRKANSIVLEGDGQHLKTDALTSVVVIIGVGLVLLTGVQALDSLSGLLMAGYILWTGFDLVRRSFHGLMDHALPATEIAAVRSAIESRLEPGVTYHALRTRQAGARRFVDFHLLVPGVYSVKRAHDTVNRIEDSVCQAIPGTEVTIHIEPIEEPEVWNDSEVLKVEQEQLSQQTKASTPDATRSPSGRG